MLPVGGFKTREVKLSGGPVTVRGLSFVEAQSVRGADASLIMIAAATGESLADVKSWAAQVPAGDVTKLIEAIDELSGLSEDAQFQGGTADDAGADGAADNG